jgi:hypothetical protein
VVITDAGSCRFGKWMAEEGKKRFGKPESFRKIQVPHHAVHDLIRTMYGFVDPEDRRLENETVIIEDAQRVEAASKELFALLDEMKKERWEMR